MGRMYYLAAVRGVFDSPEICLLRDPASLLKVRAHLHPTPTLSWVSRLGGGEHAFSPMEG